MEKTNNKKSTSCPAAPTHGSSETSATHLSPAQKPIDISTVYLAGLLLLAILGACYLAAEIILPICVAFILNLVFRPVARRMHKMHIPHGLAAGMIILFLIASLGALGTALSGPAGVWGQKLPDALPKLQERLHFLIDPVSTIQKTVSKAETVAGGENEKTLNVAVRGDGLSDKLFSSTRILIGGILETLLVLFFLLISGETFQQRFIEILPKVQDKKKALQISHQIERDISAYLRTITVMNVLVGIATTLIMYACGVGDPLLWGTVAFLFNFVPILGPLAGVCVFLVAGMLAKESLAMAFLPAGLYFCVHLLEGELVTPLILSRRFTLNPALVILMLIFWYWMWGVAGAILATPMLAILKIICDRTTRLKPFGHLIEG